MSFVRFSELSGTSILPIHDRSVVTQGVAQGLRVYVAETLKIKAIEQKTPFKTDWLVWSELSQGVTWPNTC